jgi:hypothetical protein
MKLLTVLDDRGEAYAGIRGRAPVSASSTKETSAARLAPSFSQSTWSCGTSRATQVVRPSGKVVATLSYVCSIPATT